MIRAATIRDGDGAVELTRAEPARCHIDRLANMALDALEAQPIPSRNPVLVFALSDLIQHLGMDLDDILPSHAALWTVSVERA